MSQPAHTITTIQRATVIAVPAPPASPAPLYQTLDDEFDDCLLQTEINEIGMRQQEQIQGSTLRTLVCPYCQMGGLDAKELRDHCNAQLAYDSTCVVCPVCVVLPHGDPQYYSRNFIGHLNLRHIEDITSREEKSREEKSQNRSVRCWRNRCVFRRFLKMATESADLVAVGRSFHIGGTDPEKVRERDFLPLWDGTTRRRSFAERRDLAGTYVCTTSSGLVGQEQRLKFDASDYGKPSYIVKCFMTHTCYG
ncbi:uncharacterized protein LOC130434579 [Triplophysa dalaica]|uniref:uncharacterized protein LOC130434579 n=1 Tax=Triplophysa dalaica TaxID=1582913 RepID=UPI0024DFBF95|nr:uncharacterized protein LOC130434579 [Triplophysa dalaica]